MERHCQIGDYVRVDTGRDIVILIFVRGRNSRGWEVVNPSWENLHQQSPLVISFTATLVGKDPIESHRHLHSVAEIGS